MVSTSMTNTSPLQIIDKVLLGDGHWVDGDGSSWGFKLACYEGG